MQENYFLLDTGQASKLEQFGPYVIQRPAAQAMWGQTLPSMTWEKADASFSREGKNTWALRRELPTEWTCRLEGLLFKIAPTDFGHLGIFPEHSTLWPEMTLQIQKQSRPPRILNLFAYSGGATLAAAKAGASVCHLDASKGMVSWARDNAKLNNLEKAPIRWIVDDVMKFLIRENKRGSRYEGIILDPPSFGRGNMGEVFKIEKDLQPLLNLCLSVLSENPLFVLFTTHTQGMTPLVMEHLMGQMMKNKGGHLQVGEMVIPSKTGLSLPCGSFAKWYK